MTNVDPTELSDHLRHNPQLVSAIDRITEQLEAGQSVDIEQYAVEVPQHADFLRQLVQTLRAVAELGRVEDVGPGSDGHQRSPKQIAEFSIVREVGRGGMGIVYEAVQGSLDRRVALKVFPFAAVMDDRQLTRFKNEARAAATLHHPNIVPVFSVGSDKSMHYYAMQFIDGPSLAQLLNALCLTEETEGNRVATETGRELQLAISTRKPNQDGSYERRVAQWGTEAAEALAYAHEHGVLHRDIKPANLLVDRSGKLWTTDFGLARFEKDVSLTITGDLIGTLRYMSPEQALAKRVLIDHRTDIYSLGLTLYEMLTRCPAFSGTDRQELLRQIAFTDPVPIRTHNPALPIELETIVLKATEKNPDDRYLSAQELAADLRRFLEHRPIKAKRPSLLTRATKWTVRHRSGVVASCLSLFVVLLTIGVVQWVAASHIQGIADELAQTNKELRQEKSQADAALDVALGAVESSFSDQIEAMLATQRGVEIEIGRFRQQLAETYETMLSLKPENARIRLGGARAFLLNVSSKQKNNGLAGKRAARAAVALVHDLPIESLGTDQVAIVARILTNPSYVDSDASKIDIAVKAKHAVDLYAKQCTQDVASQHRLVHLQLDVSRMLDHASAKEKYARQAILSARKAVDIAPRNAFSHALLAIAFAEGSRIHPELKSEAIDVIQQASRNELIEVSPSSVLKSLHGKLMLMTARDFDRRKTALDLLNEATRIFQAIDAYEPKHVSDLLDAKSSLCRWQLRSGDLTGAAETAEESIKLLETGAKHNREVLKLSRKMRETFCLCALTLMVLGEFETARATLEDCQAVEGEWTETRGASQPSTDADVKSELYELTARIAVDLIGQNEQAETDTRLRDSIVYCAERFTSNESRRHYRVFQFHPDPAIAKQSILGLKALARTEFEERTDSFNYFRYLNPQMLGPYLDSVDFAECHRMMETIKTTRRVSGPMANEWCATYAWSLYRIGRIEEANKWFIQAKDSEPFKLDPFPTLGLAITYHKLDQAEAAIPAFQDGLEKADSRYGNFLPRDTIATLHEAAKELGQEAALAEFLAGRQTPSHTFASNK